MKRCLTALVLLLALLVFPQGVYSAISALGGGVSHETPVKQGIATSTRPATATSTHPGGNIYPPRLETPPDASQPLSAAQEAIKAEVDASYAQYPAMDAVVACESDFRQFDTSGAPLVSPTHDVGVMQINIPTWGARARALGLDIYGSAADNIAMGKIVLAEQGIRAWTCAR